MSRCYELIITLVESELWVKYGKSFLPSLKTISLILSSVGKIKEAIAYEHSPYFNTVKVIFLRVIEN